MSVRRLLLAGCAVVFAAACSDERDGGATSDAVVASTTTDDSRPVRTTAPDTTMTTDAGTVPTADTTATSAPPADPLEVMTSSGPVRGGDSAVAGVRQFLAIPYAAAPVGEMRWRPPEPAPTWQQPLDATAPGAACPQSTEGVTAAVTVIPAWNEDCLTLSVWTPRDADGLPVMVWFHGGGLSEGSAHQPLYIGDHLAARGVVVVNVNYRLGALGFLVTDELAAEGGAFGNYGLADQVAALHWVADNVSLFGGDAGNVTIFGESAGGSSVCAHLASPTSAGLFQQAIVQSGGGCDRLLTADEARAAGTAFRDASGCLDLTCLRAMSAEQLLGIPFSPALVADGTVLTTTALDQAIAGTPTTTPVLIGSNADEATLFTIGTPEPTEQDLLTRAGATAGGDPASVLALYPPEQYASGLARLQALLSDTGFICPTLEFAAAAPTTTFVYHYTYVSPSNPFGLGATHGAELVLLFAHPEGIRGLPTEFDPSTGTVSDGIQQAWVAFATAGDPGWTSFAEQGEIRLLDDPLASTTEIRDGRCAALAELAP